jgi:uncharacterized phiE125 gp8 family phage protein
MSHDVRSCSLTLDTAPARAPISVGDVKAHARIDTDADADRYLPDLVNAAIARFDGPEGELGRALIAQTWVFRLSGFRTPIILPLPPLISVDEIAYTDPDGNSQILANSLYQVVSDRLRPAHIIPAYNESWPATRVQPDGVSVTFTAGYGTAPEGVPADIRLAIMQTVATWYEHRETVIERHSIARIPDTADAILARYRISFF